MDVKVDPRRCTVDFSGFGQDDGSGKSSFSFTARDKNGDSVISKTVFGAKIMSQDLGTETDVAIAESSGEGNYKVTFAPLPNGLYLVVLGISQGMIIQDMVKGSPFTIRVGPDPAQENRVFPDAGKSYVFGPGAKRSVARRKSNFTVQACGADGSKVKTGGDIFRAKVIPPSNAKVFNLPAIVTDQKDGTYVVTYTPTVSGDHTVNITFGNDEKHIAGSPFVINVAEAASQGEEVDPATAAIDIDGVKSFSNSIFGFPVTAKSSGGASMSLSLPFRAVIRSPEGIALPSRLVETEDGHYFFKFAPLYSGRYEVEVDVSTNGGEKYVSVSGSPISVDLQLSSSEGAYSLNVTRKRPIVRPEVPVLSPREGSPQDPLNPSPRDNTAPSPRAKINFRLSGQWVPPVVADARVPPKNPGTATRRTFSNPPPVEKQPVRVPPKGSPLNPISEKSAPSWFVPKKPAEQK